MTWQDQETKPVPVAAPLRGDFRQRAADQQSVLSGEARGSVDLVVGPDGYSILSDGYEKSGGDVAATQVSNSDSPPETLNTRSPITPTIPEDALSRRLSFTGMSVCQRRRTRQPRC